MVTGPMRVVLWILGTLGMLWLILWLVSLLTMGGMMGAGGPMGGGMNGGGMGADEMMNGRAMTMMGAMVLQVAGMLGLAGIFVHLVADSVPSHPNGRRGGEA